jgi:hypothetical protein
MSAIVPCSLLAVVDSLRALNAALSARGDGADRALRALGELVDAVTSRLAVESDDAVCTQPDFERSLRETSMALERALLAADLSRFDIEADGIIVGGTRYRHTSREKLSVLTMAGEVVIDRAVYRERVGHGGKSIGALEQRLGLVDGRTTPATAELLSTFTAATTPEESSELLAKTGTIRVSRSTLDRLAKRVNDAWEPCRVEMEEAIRLKELQAGRRLTGASTIAFSLDGIMVRMKDAPNTPGSSRSDAGPHGHREAASATLSHYDSAGARLLTVGFSRMPESKKPVIHRQLEAELRAALDANPGAQVVAIADAAQENWRIVREIGKSLGVEFTMVTDYFHAAEYLSKALDAAGCTAQERDEWRAILKDAPQGADRALAELAKHSANAATSRTLKEEKAIADALRYFNNHSQTMNYAELQGRKLPIASGVQEAACKTYIGARAKRSGMSWMPRGGQGILTMRALHLSDRLEHAWALLGPRLRVEVTVDPDASRKKPEWRAA